MGTEKDFKVKKGLTVTDNISVSGDIDVSSLYGRLNFKKNAAGNVNNDAIFFINGSDQYAGAIKYFHSGNTLRFDANQETQLHISDGAIFPPTDDDVDLGTSSLKFKDSFFGLVDAENFKINGSQGSDGQVLTSTGSGVAWENAAGGGASAIGSLDDVLMDVTNFTDSFLIQTNSDGSEPTTSFSGNNIGNVGIGKDVFTSMTTGANYNVGIGYEALDSLTTGDGNIGIGYQALATVDTQSNNIGIGTGAGQLLDNGLGNVYIGQYAGSDNSNNLSYNIGIGDRSQHKASSGWGRNVAIGQSTLRENLSGGRLVAIGDEALRNNTSADANIGIGFQALHDNTTGTRNLAIGFQALDNADTESDNIAIGYDALGGSVAGGEKNVVIGNYAGDSITSAGNNCLYGYNSGTSLTVGGFNAFFGAYSGENTTQASYNVAIGYAASENNTQSGRITAVGAFSGQSGGGSYSTYLGYAAGRFSTGERNIIIGDTAATNASGTKNIVIGQNAQGSNLTGDGNVVIGYDTDAPSSSGSRQLILSGNDGTTTTTWITGDSDGGLVLGKEGAGVVQVGDSSLNPTNMNLGKFIVSRDEATSPAGPTMSLVDGDDDANAGPILKMYRNTASPADNDSLGAISFNGEDSVGGERGYGRIRGISDDVTSGSNSGSLEFRIMSGGSQVEVMQLNSDANTSAKMTLMGVSQTGAVVSGASTANNAYLNLLTVAHGTHKAITASVHITDSTNNEVQTEMIVAHYDGSAVNYTTYGQIYDGAAAIGALEANLSGSNIIIQFKNTQGSTATIAGSIHATMHP